MKRFFCNAHLLAGSVFLLLGFLAVQTANAQDDGVCPTSLEVTKTAFVRGSTVVGEITIVNVGECEAIIGGIQDGLEVHFPGNVTPPPLPPGSTPNWWFVADIPIANPGDIPVGGQVTIPYSRCLCFGIGRRDWTGANSMRNVVRVFLDNRPEKARGNDVFYETRSESFTPPEVCRLFDRRIDLDGTASTGPGGLADWDAGVCAGTPLARWGLSNGEGIDMFDNDLNGDWTFGPRGDDLHLEGNATCATGIRNASHELGLDCKVLDIDGSLLTGQPVTCDLEFQIPFLSPCPPKVVFHDADGDGAYDNGEDVIYDSNLNGILD